jgi:DNA repair photolyase
MQIRPCTKRRVLNPCTLSGMNYQIDPYIGCEHYCYYCYALNQAETDWRREVLIYEAISRQLASELATIPPQTIYMGWQTDPYQPCEATYRQTRQVLELLQKKGFSVSILTKSDLVLRDLDVLREMKEPTVNFSVAFTDNRVRRRFEANTVDSEARIAAMRELRRVGIRSSVLLCPAIPYITDVPAVIDSVAALADTIWIYGLSILNPADRNWQHLEGILERHYNSLKSRIEDVLFTDNHAYWDHLRAELVQLGQERDMNLGIHL